VKYLLYILQSLLLLMLTPLFIGILKSLKAFIRGYSGFPVLQPYYDLKKLFNKGRIISKTSSFITKIAPIISITSSITAAFLIPVFYTGTNDYVGNLFVIFFLLSVVKFLSTLLGLDCASTFGGMGSSRELFISMFAEPIMFILVAFLYMETKTFNIFSIASTNSSFTLYSISHIIGAIAFAILLIAENARMPVDNPETHLELTMIHEAMILDLSGRDLAYIELASYTKLIVFITIFINCFFSVGIGTSLTVLSLLVGFISYIVKVIFCLIVISIIETTMAKFRLLRIPEVLAAAFSISIVAVAINFFV
jgi:formate hydrogenlyase subunit 4